MIRLIKWLLPLLAILGLLAMLYRERAASAGLRATIAKCEAVIRLNEQNVVHAAELAQEEQRARANIVATKQEQISHATVDAYRNKLAALRLRIAAQADPGRADAGAVPSLPSATGRANGAEPGFEALADAEQLTALQSWIREQAAVDPNSGAASPRPR